KPRITQITEPGWLAANAAKSRKASNWHGSDERMETAACFDMPTKAITFALWTMGVGCKIVEPYHIISL
ncbi:MAG: hypothetical protein JOZ60_12375, partial [Verrucomicrobia bacterium]|nr:hypothetical protein [Verrucomicrobiota bacterium]